MLDRVAETITRYNMFERGHRVGVAVSGGADSVCLLHVLLELAPRWALRFRVLHLNHQLRGEESRRDEEFVREIARSLGLELDVEVANLEGAAEHNLEQAARQARLAFFARSIRTGLVDRVAVGHTLQDQAETVLFRLLRGCGISGLAGILPVTDGGIVRPLLQVDRAAVRGFLRERGIPWREDSSNRDLSFARNRIRHELLPALARDWNPALPEALARLAELARQEEEHWREECHRLAGELVVWRGGAAMFRPLDLRNLSLPAARRLLRSVIERVRGDLKRIEFKHIEAAVQLMNAAGGSGALNLPGVNVRKSFDWIRFSPTSSEREPPFGGALELSVPGCACLPGDRRTVRLTLSDAPRQDAQAALLDWERLPKPLLLRGWRPGDRYRPAGCNRPVSLKTLFQKQRVPVWERENWPVIEGGGSLVWAWRFGPAQERLPDASSRPVLEISTEEEPPRAEPSGPF